MAGSFNLFGLRFSTEQNFLNAIVIAIEIAIRINRTVIGFFVQTLVVES